MADDARMTVRLRPATRRKVERLAAREGISLNEALDRLLQSAPDDGARAARRPSYQLEPRKRGFGFDIADARRLAAQLGDEQVRRRLEPER
jgi:hypothetical protein